MILYDDNMTTIQYFPFQINKIPLNSIQAMRSEFLENAATGIKVAQMTFIHAKISVSISFEHLLTL